MASQALSRRTVPSRSTQGKIKTVGVRLFNALAKRMDAAHPMLEPLRNLVTAVSALPSNSLFEDWSPPRDAPTSTVTLDKDSAVASDWMGDANVASKALPGPGYWCTHASLSESQWCVKPAAPTKVFAVDITWVTGGGRNYLPKSFQVQTSDDGSSWSTVASCDSATADTQRVVLNCPAAVGQLRIVMKDYATANTAQHHGISSFVALQACGEGSDRSSLGSLDDLHSWMTAVLKAAAEPEARKLALSGLEGLTHASASLGHLVSLADTLLSSTAALPPVDSSAFIATLRDAAAAERAVQSEEELRCGGAPSAESWGEVDAKFVCDETSGSSSRVEIREGGKVAHSSSGSHAVVFLDQGPFSAGKASWEIRLVEDTNSQCTCFGLAVQPVINCNYERSEQLWMYRAYNGYRYSNGSCNSGSGYKKIMKGDLVRLDLNMDAGTCNISINGADQGAVFTNLAGREVYPCIQFYSSGRTVRLEKFEGPTGGPAKQATVAPDFLSDMQEQKVTGLGHGSFGKAGDLGYNEGSARAIRVGGKLASCGLSFHPPENTGSDECATVSYPLAKKYDTFTTSVALNDDVTAEQLAEHGSPLYFEVLGDGVSLWKSPPVSEPKAPVEVSVSVLEVEELTLKAFVGSSNKFGHAVWVDPAATPCTDWSCDGWRNDKTAFVCALSGTKRGQVTPLPDVPADLASCHGVAVASLTYAGFLANEYLRGMRSPPAPSSDGVSGADLESPFSVQVAADVLRHLADMLSRTADGVLPADVLEPLLYLTRANMRRLIVSRVDPASVGLRSAESESKSDEPAAGGGPDVLAEIHTALQRVAGGGDPVMAALALQIESMAIRLFMPSVEARVSRFESLIPAGGVVEVQLNFPCDVNDGDGRAVALDALVLMLQLHCSQAGASFKLLGRWPAKVYVVMDVPAEVGLQAFLTGAFASALERAKVQSWHFPDGVASPELPLLVESSPSWDRRGRLPFESGIGVVHAYPSSTSTFDAVVASIQKLLPAAK